MRQIVYITGFLYLDSFTRKNQTFVVRWALGEEKRDRTSPPPMPYTKHRVTFHSQHSTHP
ncbi:MAG: hypothetical protein HWQ41_00505 [Nostoc sp. NOS(2021)]|uniref:hypothetical protein n=1 Tax=Nostoc sp. NOS(2021) TaxID=2815407 RepID=UPI0025E804A7|nr:hypothetical protein [Nostoc sp. NOS(2021)]MBN3893825.1 hypothetical protein [Nostoc sp. NOS(2021)]